MWTPKRILLLVLSAVLFLAGYLLYSNRLGAIDGLPPLPEQYWPGAPSSPPPAVRPPSLTVRKLEQAFGKGSEEAKPSRPIKIEVPARGMILSAGDFVILPKPDGRVRLTPLSVALFGKTKGEDGTPEINTIRGDVAYLTFERPIESLQDMGKYRIIAAHIAGKIRIVNNHRTARRDDDLSVYIRNGPLFYRQKDQRIWTDDFVRLVDNASKPRPTVITGHGMILDLIAEAPTGGTGHARARKQQFDNVTGVRRIHLLSNVDMDLYVDGRSGFLSSEKKPAAPPRGKKDAAKKPEPEKSHLMIKTPGPFLYDLQKEFARFDIPRQRRRRRETTQPEQVEVVRKDDLTGKIDQLVCEHLELQFQKKKETSKHRSQGTSAGSRGKSLAEPDHSGLQIETAHAFGGTVVLVSDAEALEAHGKDFTYDARTLLSILKGAPMWALKELNTIKSPELRIKRFKDGKGQEVTALGPGKLDLYDKATRKQSQHARWTDRLLSTKDGACDLLHLIGNASFVDEVNGQELRAEEIKVWLDEKENKDAPKTAPKGVAEKSGDKPQQARRPRRVVADRHVTAKSAEFNILQARRFVVWFKDAPPGAIPPAARPGQGPATKVTPSPGITPAVRVPTPEGPAPKTQAARTTQPKTGPVTIQKPGTEPRKPIDLTARSVEARVLRFGERTQLQDMRAEGAVHVTQEPAKPTEKGVDIKGETLRLIAQPEGNLLTVTGDLGRLEMDRLMIMGPTVNIDQTTNKAWVDGIGAMTMESDTDLQGKKLKKVVPLTIHWNKSMYFNGTFAEFHGGIQAEQENSRLACQALQVFFDKPISLKEGNRGGERSRVRNLVADQSARAEDTTFENGERTRFNGLTAIGIAFDNEESIVQAVGPGAVRIIQKGNALDPEPTPGSGKRVTTRVLKPGEKAADDDGLKLTYVNYEQRMFANKKTNMAVFYQNVRVYYKPVEDFDKAQTEEIDLDLLFKKPLPEGAMYLRCARLEVRSRPREKGKAYQEMYASGRASVLSQDFSGTAERVIFDEEKDQVIFDGGETGIATLYKRGKSVGGPPNKIQGQKIIYSRKTGQHTGIGIKSLEGAQ